MTDLQQPPADKSAPALNPARPIITFPKIGIKSGRIDVFSSGLVIAFLNNPIEFDLRDCIIFSSAHRRLVEVTSPCFILFTRVRWQVQNEDLQPGLSPSTSLSQGSGTLLAGEFTRTTTVHTNVERDVIVIDANKVRLLLNKKYDSLKAQRDWTTPVGIFLALVIAQVSADFKATWGLIGPTWHAIFVISSLLCAAWSFTTIVKAIRMWGKNSVDEIVDEMLKQQSGANPTAH